MLQKDVIARLSVKSQPDRCVDSFKQHNKEVEEVWEAYRKDKPIRVPVMGGLEIQPFLKIKNYSSKRYYTDPEFMIRCQLEKQRWCREHIFADAEVGLPEM